MTNQWPTFPVSLTAPTVRRVVLEEGNGIVERTGGDIIFRVESEPEDSGGIVHQCFLAVPKAGYRYPLLRIVQTGIDYPVTVVADIYPQGTAATAEDDLRQKLGQVFQSDPVKRVVSQLLELLE